MSGLFKKFRSSVAPAVKKGKPAETAKEEKPSPSQLDELGGPEGPEPTRFGDWERGGRCVDF